MDSRLLWGTVDMLILDVVSRSPSYGYQIAQTVTAQSKDYFDLKEGSLYPALHRLADPRLSALGSAQINARWILAADAAARVTVGAALDTGAPFLVHYGPALPLACLGAFRRPDFGRRPARPPAGPWPGPRFPPWRTSCTSMY